MRVYHFLNKKYGLESLSKQRLKVSLLDDLNDPFELFSINTGDKELRGILEGMKNYLAKERGILCFSKHWYNPLLWGHYSDKHKGVCLGFDVPDGILKKIDYTSHREKIYPENADTVTEKQFFFTKFDGWKYEKEYREWINLNTHSFSNGMYFKKYSYDLVLKEIIVGCQSDITRNDVSEAMSNNFPHIKPHKARASFQKFKIVRNQNSKLWK